MARRGFPWPIFLIVCVLVLGGLGAAFGTGVLRGLPRITIGDQPTPTPVIVVATPQPGKIVGPQPYSDVPMVTGGEPEGGDDSTWVNGFNIRNNAQAKVRDAYRVFATYIGFPVGPYEHDCQTFQFGKLCYDFTAEPYHVSLDNLGQTRMTDDGLTPDSTSQPHPAVKAWMDEAAVVSMTKDRLTGAVISPPDCNRYPGWCVQYTQRFLLVVPDGATKASQVFKAPLGLMNLRKATAVPTPAVILVPQPTPAAPPKDEGLPWGMIALGAVVLVLGGLLAANMMNRGGYRGR